MVYQAYRPAIALYAVKHQCFGGEFSFSRMSWIKPNFLWMMHRSGWATKEGQEHVLAVCLRRIFFDRILSEAVASSFSGSGFAEEEEWKRRLAGSDARIQWDPDHAPDGRPLVRRAVQLGLRGIFLRGFATGEILSIVDISDIARAQHEQYSRGTPFLVPQERVYRPADEALAQQLGLSK